MATFVLTTPNTPRSYSFRVDLEGTTFRLDFVFNERAGSWFYSIYDAEDAAILVGQRVVADWEMARRVVSSNRPLGVLFMLDQTDEGDTPSETELGERLAVLYAESEA